MIRFHEALLDFVQWKEQDPELAAYSGETIWLERCDRCGFAQPDRIPALPRYFERMYDQRWSPDWVVSEYEATYKDLIFRRILDALGRRVSPERRSLLDVGSHAGRFLHLAADAGWQAEGIELNSRTATYATDRTGAQVHRINARQIPDLGRRFDAVTLTDVLEHVPEPVAVLSNVRAALADGGWIAVKVPCGPAQTLKETWRSRLQRGYRATLADNLVHVSHFSPGALRLALERAGFDEIALEVAAPECPSGGAGSNWLRLAVFRLALAVPSGIHTPLALNLQAYARSAGRA
jgi:SAM-dependent methyltransferase